MAYHITKKGTPAICTAKSPESCPLGEHFETALEAQSFADYKNEEKALADKYPQTTKTSLIKYAGLDEIYNLNFDRQIFKIDKKLQHLERMEKQKHRRLNKQQKEKALRQFKQTDAVYQTLSMEKKEKLKELNKIIEERNQAADFIQNTKNHLEDFSFSKASSSTYVLYKEESLKSVVKELEGKGFNVKIRPNIESSLDTNYLVRFANHYPKEYYVQQRKGNRVTESDVWKYTDASILVEFKQVDSNKINKKEVDEKVNKYKKYTTSKLSIIHESLEKE